jgi:hypothetical protein
MERPDLPAALRAFEFRDGDSDDVVMVVASDLPRQNQRTAVRKLMRAARQSGWIRRGAPLPVLAAGAWRIARRTALPLHFGTAATAVTAATATVVIAGAASWGLIHVASDNRGQPATTRQIAPPARPRRHRPQPAIPAATPTARARTSTGPALPGASSPAAISPSSASSPILGILPPLPTVSVPLPTITVPVPLPTVSVPLPSLPVPLPSPTCVQLPIAGCVSVPVHLGRAA